MNISKNIIGIIIILTLFNCSDFLYEESLSNVSPETFYTIPDHAEAAVAAIYADMRGMWGDAGIFSSTWQMLEAPTGTTTTETAQNSDLNNLYTLSYDPNTQHIINYWNSLYKVIAQANLAIDKIPSINPMDENQKVSLIGEAKFLRAWAYFYVVRLWGDAPLILNPQTASSEDFYPSRSSVESIYNLIIEDLKSAENAGLPWMDESGRVNLSATKALLSKVYLTMAGYPLNRGNEYYKLAADKSKEIIDYANSSPNSINLFPSYMDIHNESKKNILEHIFMVQYNTTVAGNPMGNMHPNFKPVTYSGPSGTGSTIPTLSFYDSFEEGDLRAKDQDGFFYTSYYLNGSGEPFDLGAPYIFKHFNFIANGIHNVPGTRQNNLNVPLIRYAEVLLNYAEAQNEISGPTSEAYTAFKRIRDRAQLETPELSTFDINSFREAIWKERWHELCFEGITWFDMVRLRKVYNEINDGFDDFVGHVNLNSNQALKEKNLLFPLPRPEMVNNPNLTPQNPNYVE